MFELIRFCIMCRGRIPHERVVHGATTCGQDCKRKHRIEMRLYKASKDCRLCGRKARKPKEANDAVALGAQECLGGMVNA